jgi:hypothetical protein
MIAYFRQNRCGALLTALCLLILVDSSVGLGSWVSALLTALLVVTLVLATWALRVRGPTLVALGVLGLVVVVVLLVRLDDRHWLWAVGLAALAAFTGIITICLLHYVLNLQAITADKVFGAVDAYVLIAFTFASLFGLLEFVQAHAFHVTVPGIEGPLSWVELMYFSFTVLTSTGFGEITPATNMARSLIVIEQVLGVMYVAFLIARLANLYGRDGGR